MSEVILPDSDEIREDFPSNSQVKKPEDPPKAKKSIKGQAIQRKPSLTRRFIKAFTGDDVTDVKSYLVDEVAIPTVKNLICDIFEYGPQMLLFGEIRGKKRDRNRGGREYTSYDRYYRSDRDRDRDRGRSSRPASPRYDSGEIILRNREEAETVIADLCDRIEDYGRATIADLNDMVGITSGDFTDNYWGWDDRSAMARATYRRVREGYLLILPEAVNLRWGS